MWNEPSLEELIKLLKLYDTEKTLIFVGDEIGLGYMPDNYTRLPHNILRDKIVGMLTSPMVSSIEAYYDENYSR